MAQEVTQLSVPNFPLEDKERLEREAKRQDRSLASYIRTVLTDHLDKLEREQREKQPA
jgi:predicted DNA-binding protein